ncbi:MAG: maltokinase, partial [Gaiellales bacterium]|nr:maltokinase [Gaiellales bacterium]
MTGAGEAAAQLIGAQRWFGSKARPLVGGRVVDAGDLPDGCVFALYEAEFADGGSELYQLPHRIAASGALELSLADPVLGGSLLVALRHSAAVSTRAGRLEFTLVGELPGAADLEPVRAVGGEQSNSSVVFGERVILKAYRRLEAGESPELELLRVLDAQGFEHTPRLLGWYRYAGESLDATLGLLQEFVADAPDGWALALESFADPASFHASLGQLGA